MKTKKSFGIFRNTDAELAHWFVKLAYKGRRHSFDLGTHVKADAAKRAREIYLSLHANGWEPTLANFAPGVASGPPTTVGELSERAVATFHGSRRSINDYTQALRRVAADIAGIPTPGRRFSAGGDYDKRLERINKLKLSVLSWEKVEAWRKNFVDAAGDDPLAERSAKTSANSYIRQLKALFSPERLALLGLAVESPVARVKLYKKADMRFKSSIDPVALFKAGLAELPTQQLKAFVLMLCAGLRKNEADKITWSAIDWDAGQIRVETTKYLKVKSEKSIGSVDLDQQVLALFRGWRAAAPDDEFILKGEKARLNMNYARYRCVSTFKQLTEWLRTKGVSDKKPLHTLRKLFGSMLNDRFGLHVASLGLRHADIGITASHYVSKRASATVGLGAVIDEAGKVVEFSAEAGKTPEKGLQENAG